MNSSGTEYLISLNTQLLSFTSPISTVTNYLGIAIEIIVFAFLIHQFIRKRNSSKLCTAFFKLLWIGYFMDLFYVVIWTMKFYLARNKSELGFFGLLLVYCNSITQWHAIIFIGPWNVLLALNRLSSLIYMSHYEKIWSKYFFHGISILFLYPFVANGYSFLDLYCRFHLKYPECFNYFKETFIFTAISNGIFSIISLFIGIATFIAYRKKLGSSNIAGKSVNKYKTEQKLLFQSLFISIFFGIYCIGTGLYHFYSNSTTPEGKLTFTIVNFFFSSSKFLHHYFSILLLFLFSKTIRREFYETFHLKYIWKIKTTVRKISTASKMPKTAVPVT